LGGPDVGLYGHFVISFSVTHLMQTWSAEGHLKKQSKYEKNNRFNACNIDSIIQFLAIGYFSQTKVSSLLIQYRNLVIDNYDIKLSKNFEQ